jgi:hypothetical protein
MEFSNEKVLQLKAMKAHIKTLVAEQKSLKLQRKTTKFTGTREMEPYQAVYQHAENRFELRHLYLAYGIMRGRSVEQIESKSKTPYNEKTLEKILKTYDHEGSQNVCAGS